MNVERLDITPSEAMNSELLFEPFFRGPSWDTWRSVVKAAFAESQTATELELFRSVANRDPPEQPVKELVCAVGRGSGKDSVASFLATYLAASFDPRGKLRPGERAYILCIAVDKSQAAIAYNYIKGYFEQIPALASLVTNVGPSSIELRNGVCIETIVNSYRAVRGRSLLAVILDEAAFLRDENYANPDLELYNAISPGLARVKGSMLLVISSVHKRSGLLYSKIKNCHGKNDPATLAVVGSTLVFNPSFEKAMIDKALEEDPERFGAEYLCRWRDDLCSYIDRQLLDAALDANVLVRPPIHGKNYIAACDASGGRNDSFTAAVGHREDNNSIVLDCIYERKSPFNPSEVVDEISKLIKTYRTSQIMGDRYSASWVTEAFKKCGINYVQSERDRSAVYMDTLPVFTSGRAAKMISQFAALQRRTFPIGRERVDPGVGHDDIANSVAIALSLCALNHCTLITQEAIDKIRVNPRHGRPMSRPYGPPNVFVGSVSDFIN